MKHCYTTHGRLGNTNKPVSKYEHNYISATCPDQMDYHESTGTCFGLTSQRYTFADGMEMCSTWDPVTHLADIHSLEENNIAKYYKLKLRKFHCLVLIACMLIIMIPNTICTSTHPHNCSQHVFLSYYVMFLLNIIIQFSSIKLPTHKTLKIFYIFTENLYSIICSDRTNWYMYFGYCYGGGDCILYTKHIVDSGPGSPSDLVLSS